MNLNLRQEWVRGCCLPIDIPAVFNRQDIHRFGSGLPVEDSKGPDSVGPDSIFLEFAFQRFDVEGMFCEVSDGVFDFVTRSGVEGCQIFEQ